MPPCDPRKRTGIHPEVRRGRKEAVNSMRKMARAAHTEPQPGWSRSRSGEGRGMIA